MPLNWEKLKNAAMKNKDDKDCIILNKEYEVGKFGEIPWYIAIISEKKTYSLKNK